MPLPLFLHGQSLSELLAVSDPDERRFHVCGGVSGQDTIKRPEPARDAWKSIERQVVRQKASGRDAHHRVALVCDAGLGKTTNLEWLAAAIAQERSACQVPFVLRLDSLDDIRRLEGEDESPNTLLRWMAARLAQAAGGEVHHHQETLARIQRQGRITLLLDGLDHALSRPGLAQMLGRFLQSTQWQRCPVWVSGRPYAFDNTWAGLFDWPEWHFLRVESLAEPEIRLYLRHQAEGDWFDDIAPEGRHLLAIPRLLRLTAGILGEAVRSAVASGQEPVAAVKALDLRTASDVYHLAYFTPGEWIDPEHRQPGQTDRRGLLASGLVGKAARIGLTPHEQPSATNYRQRITRTATLLGAIAFEMLAAGTDSATPRPNLAGVPEEEMEGFKDAVASRIEGTRPRRGLNFYTDFDLLAEMNISAVDFLLFRDLGQKGLVWHDRTVQAFFAACWAMKFGSEKERQLIERWIVDTEGKRLAGFDEFWVFAAELPDALVERGRLLEAFGRCFAPPQSGYRERLPEALKESKKNHDWVQWHRRMSYHSFERMQKRSRETIEKWRSSYSGLANGTPKQRRIYEEIQGGFQPIPAGVCPYGADPLHGAEGTTRQVSAFHMHQWPVTNEMYEEFDPHHRADRWVFGTHQLAAEEDRCPVVKVTWYDAWCFAAWCGHRLPNELEWEYACRAGSADAWCFGNEEADLVRYGWYDQNSNYSTHPVGQLERNAFRLCDMHGNVWEWCNDRWTPSASARVFRGGCWAYSGVYCRSASRSRDGSAHQHHGIFGFRLVAVLASLEPSKVV